MVNEKEYTTEIKKGTLSEIKREGLLITVTFYDIEYKVTHELHPASKESIKVAERKELSRTIKKINYFELKEVTRQEILSYRKERIPSLIVKMDDKLYWAKVPFELNFVSAKIFNGSHLCAGDSGSMVCTRLSSASDEDGGCEKVRRKSNRIEEMNFITEGFETFATKVKICHINQCNHFCIERPHYQRHELHEPKYVWL